MEIAELKGVLVLAGFLSVLIAGFLIILSRTETAYRICLGSALSSMTIVAYLEQGLMGVSCVGLVLFVGLPLALSLISSAVIHLVWAKVRRTYPAEPASPPSKGLSFKEAGRFILGLDR